MRVQHPAPLNRLSDVRSTRNCPKREGTAASTPLLPSQIEPRKERRCRSTVRGPGVGGSVAPAASSRAPDAVSCPAWGGTAASTPHPCLMRLV